MYIKFRVWGLIRSHGAEFGIELRFRFGTGDSICNEKIKLCVFVSYKFPSKHAQEEDLLVSLKCLACRFCNSVRIENIRSNLKVECMYGFMSASV